MSGIICESVVQLPQGKGMFIWKIKNCAGGDVDAIARQAAALGLSWVAPKITAGWHTYNWRKDASGVWVDDYIPALKAALDAVGVALWGWGSVWLLNGDREATVAKARVEQFGLQGFLIDAEGQAKESADRYRQARNYSAVMGQADFAVGLCSYRYPEYHPELPWDELLDCCDFHAPQVYWIHGRDPAGQLGLSMSSLRVLRDLPFVPAGPAFDEHGWCPMSTELDDFDAACQDTGCLGVIWWEWDEADDNDFLDVIGRHDWGVGPEPVLTLEEKVEIVKGAVEQLHGVVLW